MNTKVDPVFRDILGMFDQPINHTAAAAIMPSPLAQLVLRADRQYIHAATTRIRELEELVAYQERHIQELLDQLLTLKRSI